jgi:hypothetical protein
VKSHSHKTESQFRSFQSACPESNRRVPPLRFVQHRISPFQSFQKFHRCAPFKTFQPNAGSKRSRVPVVPIVPAIKRRAQRDQTFSEIRDRQQLTNSIRPMQTSAAWQRWPQPVTVSDFPQDGCFVIRCRQDKRLGELWLPLDQLKRLH